ncbi:MAG: hypothetical protein ACREN1_00240, partial [Candidatus Dormibacteria bacterium]
MTRTTTVRDAAGNVISTTTTTGGFGSWASWWGISIISGFGWWLMDLAVLFLVAVPAAEFPLWGAILAYI